MFFDASAFNQPLEQWNVGNVTNMGFMFYNASAFNQPLANWEREDSTIENVTNMKDMFNGASAFNQPLEQWNVGNVTNMRGMFRGASFFNQPLANWEREDSTIENVTNMKDMFNGASAFNQPLEQWNVGNVTNMRGMFRGASFFNQPLANWEREDSTIENVTNMAYMFQGAISFNKPIEKWKVGNVTNMQAMFNYASVFNQPLGGWDVRNVTDMEAMFMNAIAFSQPLGQWNVGNMTRIPVMFDNATAFLQRYPDADNDPRSVFTSTETNTPNGIEFDNDTLREAVHLWIRNREEAISQYGDINTWNVSQVTDMIGLFSNRFTFNDDIGNWNVGNVTNMENMFSFASRFNQPLEQWNVSNVTNMGSMFNGASAFNQPLANWERSNSTVGNVTNMRSMFFSAHAFNQPLEQWNVGNVTDMGGMFWDASAFIERYPNADNDPRSVFTSTETNTPNGIEFDEDTLREAVNLWIRNREEAISQYGDINTWNVSQVTNMSELFSFRRNFNDNISQWDVGNVTNMQGMFYNASAFNQPLEQWNVGNVTNMQSMFNSASSFNQPLEQWEVSNETNILHMFKNATAILQRYPNADNDPRSVFTSTETNTPNGIEFDNDTLREAVNLWFSDRDEAIRQYGDINTWNVSKVTDMSELFNDRRDFNDDISNWDVGNVTNMYAMFDHASIFNQPLGQWNVLKVTNMRAMFFHAKAFNQPLEQWNVSNVTNMSLMFSFAIAFNQDIRHWDITNVINIENMFREATDFRQRYPEVGRNIRSIFFKPLNDETLREAVNLWSAGYTEAISQYGEISRWNVSKVTNMSKLFQNRWYFNDDISNWNVGNVTNMMYMFSGASAFNQPLEQWNVGNVTNMMYMFEGAKAFNQPLEQWNVGNVTNMHGMFFHAKAFNQPLEQWNVSNVTTMRNMFQGASSFNQPLNRWERANSTLRNVTNMEGMFNSAAAFNQPLGQWNVDNVTNMHAMFEDASTFNQPLEQWDVGNVDNMEGMFNGSAIIRRYPIAEEDPNSVFNSFSDYNMIQNFDDDDNSDSNISDVRANLFGSDDDEEIINNIEETTQESIQRNDNDTCEIYTPKDGDYVSAKGRININGVVRDSPNRLFSYFKVDRQKFNGFGIYETIGNIDRIDIFFNESNDVRSSRYTKIDKYDYLRDLHINYIKKILKKESEENDPLIEPANTYEIIYYEDDIPVEINDNLISFEDIAKYFFKNQIQGNEKNIITKKHLLKIRYKNNPGSDYGGLFKQTINELVKSITGNYGNSDNYSRNSLLTFADRSITFNKDFNNVNYNFLNNSFLDEFVNSINSITNDEYKNGNKYFTKITGINYAFTETPLEYSKLNKLFTFFYLGSFISRCLTLEPHHTIIDDYGSFFCIPNLIFDPYILLTLKFYINKYVAKDTNYKPVYFNYQKLFDLYNDIIPSDLDILNDYKEEEDFIRLSNTYFPSQYMTVYEILSLYRSQISNDNDLYHSKSYKILRMLEIDNEEDWNKYWEANKYSEKVYKILYSIIGETDDEESIFNYSNNDYFNYKNDKLIIEFSKRKIEAFVEFMLKYEFENPENTGFYTASFAKGFYKTYFESSVHYMETYKRLSRSFFDTFTTVLDNSANINYFRQLGEKFYRDVYLEIYSKNIFSELTISELNCLISGPEEINKDKLKKSIEIIILNNEYSYLVNDGYITPNEISNREEFKNKFKIIVNKCIDDSDQNTLKYFLAYTTGLANIVPTKLQIEIISRNQEMKDVSSKSGILPSKWFSIHQLVNVHTCFNKFDAEFLFFKDLDDLQKQKKEIIDDLLQTANNDETITSEDIDLINTMSERKIEKVINEIDDSEKREKIDKYINEKKPNLFEIDWLIEQNIKNTLFNIEWLKQKSFSLAGGGDREITLRLRNFIN